MIWFRVLETLIKSVSLTFSILLAIYLGSMAVGSLLGTRWGSRRNLQQRESLFLRAQILLYTYVGVSFLVFTWAIGSVDALSFLWEYFKSYEPDLTPGIIIPTYIVIPLFLMFVPTLLMGVSFSVSQLIIQDDPALVGRKVGWLQFINIVGSALGAWCVTWIGFEFLGTATLIKLISLLGICYLVVAVVRKHFVGSGLAIGIVVIVGIAVLLPDNFTFWRRMGGMDEPERFIYDENASGLSVIKRYERKGALVGVVFANGLGQSIIPYDRDAVHTKLGAFPVLLHPMPKSIAVVGMGSSGTLHGTAARPETEKLVCFEIMSNQPKVLKAYAEHVHDSLILAMLADPRLELIPHDGRYRLTTMPDRYDVIEADALRPNSAFSGNIYSKEYFQLLLSRLNPGGFAASYCPSQRVLNSAREVFPYLLYVDSIMIIGSNAPITLDMELLQQRLSSPYTQAHFKAANIDISGLIIPFALNAQRMEPLPGVSSDINTDLFPKDEFEMPYTWALFKKKIFGE